MRIGALTACFAAIVCLAIGYRVGRGDGPTPAGPAANRPIGQLADNPAGATADKATADKAAADKASAASEAEQKDEREFYELYKALGDTVDQVDRNYVKKVSRRELMEAAIKGVLSKLDPYSNYIGPDEADQFRDTVESQFAGIGIQITVEDDGQLRILSPLVGTPAYKAGLLAGDRIVKIAGESTAGWSMDDAVHKLKGPVGSTVAMTIIHPGHGEPKTVDIKREFIHVETVLGDRRKADDTWDYMLDAAKGIGYIRITTFARDTPQDLRRAVEDLRAHKMRGLIIDLRYNPGGLLTSAVQTCDMFLDGGRIVSTEGRNSPKQVWDASKKDNAYTGFPIAILVNHYSASASEIFSACLQDHGRAVVVGSRTWGKGSVQNVIELEDGKSLLKLTTASYLRPNGHNIHRFPDAKETDEWGVKPNPGYEVKLDDAEAINLMIDRRERDILVHHDAGEATAAAPARSVPDRQLDKGIEYVTSELARAK